MFQNKIVRNLLAPASFAYGLGAFCRMQAYASGLAPRVTSSVPVISIGNITVGGTGKTPLTIDIARQLGAQGRRLAILSRGYKRKSKQPFVIVSDGGSHRASVHDSGDEPFLLARAVPEAVVIAGADRTRTAQLACQEYLADVIILDDGFQHVRLKRKYDIVLIDYSDDLADEPLLPAGRLREPLTSLGRASHVVLTKIPEMADRARLESIGEMVARYAPQAQLHLCRFKPKRLRPLSSLLEDSFQFADTATRGPAGQPFATAALENARVLLVSGIARPKSFQSAAGTFCRNIVAELTFPDHHWYSTADVRSIEREMARHQADYIVTTEKDLVKLAAPEVPFKELQDKIYAVELAAEWLGSAPRFELAPAHEVVT